MLWPELRKGCNHGGHMQPKLQSFIGRKTKIFLVPCVKQIILSSSFCCYLTYMLFFFTCVLKITAHCFPHQRSLHYCSDIKQSDVNFMQHWPLLLLLPFLEECTNRKVWKKMTFLPKLLNRTHPELTDIEWVVSSMQHIPSFNHIYRTHAPCQQADLHHQCVQMMIKVLPENWEVEWSMLGVDKGRVSAIFNCFCLSF